MREALQRAAVGLASVIFAVVLPLCGPQGDAAVVYVAYPVAVLAIAVCVAVILDLGVRFASPTPAAAPPPPAVPGSDPLTSLPPELFCQLARQLPTAPLLHLSSSCRWADCQVDWKLVFTERWGQQLRTDSSTTILVAREELQGLGRHLQVQRPPEPCTTEL